MTVSANKICSTTQVPLVVWRGGTGGVASAVQAARHGIRTLL